jgi:23S rRNA pseudouridine1911/1915/1917 synthase
MSDPERTIEAGVTAGLFRCVVDDAHAGQRLDRTLAAAAETAGVLLSRTRIQSLIADGHVRVGDIVARSGRETPPAGSTLSVLLPEPEAPDPLPEAMPLAVVFEDDHLVIIDKPAGLVVHPAPGHADGTLVNALIAHCGDSLSGIGGVRRPGIVHRLDKDTSGLLVVAKTDVAHAGLTAIFADHGRSGSLVRDYVAFVWGVPGSAGGTIAAPLGRDPRNRLRVAVVSSGRGRDAVTHWRRVASFGADAAEIRCRLETGRTHQIRVHLASAGHPLIGDAVYGGGFRTKAARLGETARTAALGLGRQALHAQSLGFTHPVTGRDHLFESALPPDLAALKTALTEQMPAGTRQR